MGAIHVTAKEFASLWGCFESSGLFLKQVIVYLLKFKINALLLKETFPTADTESPV